MKISVITVLLAAMLLAGCGAPTAQAVQSAGNVTEAAAPDQSETKKSTPERISKEEAVEIALKHAGFKAEQVKYLRADYEIDDGVPQYEVQFHQDRWEYDYEINAQTGDIISYDRDD